MTLMMFKVNHGVCPSYLSDMFDVNTSRLSCDLRSSEINLIVPKARTNYFRNSFASAGAKLWNSLPSSLKEETSLKQFKAKIRSYLLFIQASCFLSLGLILCTIFLSLIFRYISISLSKLNIMHGF